MIQEKYKDVYVSFTAYEKKRYESWVQSMIVHKALLNGDPYLAFKEQIKHFFILPHPKNLLTALVILSGPKIIFRLRGRSAIPVGLAKPDLRRD